MLGYLNRSQIHGGFAKKGLLQRAAHYHFLPVETGGNSRGWIQRSKMQISQIRVIPSHLEQPIRGD
jgi:hypothetical protein